MSWRITWLGHSTVVLDVDDTRLVADPLLHKHAGALRRRGPAPRVRAWHGTDCVLLSHLHHDHAELRSLRMLDGVPVVTAPANARWLLRKGIDSAVGLREDAWFDVRGPVSVRLTPAVHGHRPMPHRPNEANGHLVRTESGIAWVVGDTEMFDGIGDIPALGGGPVYLAIVPVSGWGPRLSGGHFDAVDAARACAAVGARFAVPVHWGTLHAPAGRHFPRGWMDRAGIAFEEAVRRYAPDCQPVVIAPGESWESA